MAFKTQCKIVGAYLDKSDVSGLLAEALAADVETVFSNKTSFVCADSAGRMLAIAQCIWPAAHPHLEMYMLEKTYQARAPLP
jgi:hypothetical protein